MLTLDGTSLTIADVVLVATGNAPVGIAPGAVISIQQSRRVVEQLAAGEDAVYAVNTGVGLLADVRVPPE